MIEKKINFKKMLKVKLFITLFILLFSTKLQARTIGNYVGVDLIKTNLSFSMIKTIYETNLIEKSRQTVPDSKHSFGFKYNYAINYRGFFISPGIIYEKNKVKNHFNYSSADAESIYSVYGKSYSKINQRYGIKLDLGGDINDNLSIYGTIGQAVNYFETYGSLYHDSAYSNTLEGDGANIVIEDPWKLNKGRKSAPFFGGGFRIKLYKNWLLNGEYNYTRFTIDTKASHKQYKIGDNYELPAKIHFKNNINIFKLGINFNF